MSFQRGWYWHREEKSNFTVEKFDKHYLSQVIKFNMKSDKVKLMYVPLVWCDGNGALPQWFLSHTSSPGRIMRETSDKS